MKEFSIPLDNCTKQLPASVRARAIFSGGGL